MYLARGPWDQRGVESRRDVLLFTTDALTSPTEVTGRLLATLYVSSDCPDTDFTVKLTDVYPDGRSILIADGIQRAVPRIVLREQFMQPGEVYKVDRRYVEHILHLQCRPPHPDCRVIVECAALRTKQQYGRRALPAGCHASGYELGAPRGPLPFAYRAARVRG